MMKQYTSKDQTPKLIELGFPKPQGWGDASISNKWVMAISPNGKREDFNYSIGELIEFLPTSFSKKDKYFRLDIFPARSGWFILYATYNKEEYHRNFERELIDALFCACVTLKEEGMI